MTIESGAFDLACAGALRKTFDFPTLAFYVDVNGSGHCDAGDVGTSTQLFGWGPETFPYRLDAPVALLPPVTHLGKDDTTDFCASYFD